MRKPLIDKNGEAGELDEDFFARAKRGRPKALPKPKRKKEKPINRSA